MVKEAAETPLLSTSLLKDALTKVLAENRGRLEQPRSPLPPSNIEVRELDENQKQRHDGQEEILVMNGGDEPYYNTMEILYENRWNLQLLPGYRYRHATAKWGSKVITLGGRDGNGELLSTCVWYDFDSQEWRSLPNLPQPRCDMAAVVVHNWLYAIAGRITTEEGELESTDTVYRLNLERPRRIGWEQQESVNKARSGHCAVLIQDEPDNRAVITQDGIKHIICMLGGKQVRAIEECYPYLDPFWGISVWESDRFGDVVEGEGATALPINHNREILYGGGRIAYVRRIHREWVQAFELPHLLYGPAMAKFEGKIVLCGVEQNNGMFTPRFYIRNGEEWTEGPAMNKGRAMVNAVVIKVDRNKMEQLLMNA